jgi:hypothetical protein
MIEIRIEKITIIKDGQVIHGSGMGEAIKQDKWQRQVIYMQSFADGEEPEINKAIRIINGGEA